MLTKEEIREYVRAAKDLGYPKEVIEKLKKAKTDDEATRIMCTARHRAMNKRP